MHIEQHWTFVIINFIQMLDLQITEAPMSRDRRWMYDDWSVSGPNSNWC